MANEVADVLGLEEVNQFLDSAPTEIVAHGYLKALQAGGAVIAEELEARTPIQLVESGGDLVVEGGDLKSAVVVQITLDAQAHGGTVDVGFGKLGYVARFVEMGHHQIGHKPEKKKLGEVSPHPFMRPAAAAAADRAIAAVGDSILETVASVFPQEKL
jgi:HK97 gp10 family phage protein